MDASPISRKILKELRRADIAPNDVMANGRTAAECAHSYVARLALKKKSFHLENSST